MNIQPGKIYTAAQLQAEGLTAKHRRFFHRGIMPSGAKITGGQVEVFYLNLEGVKRFLA